MNNHIKSIYTVLCSHKASEHRIIQLANHKEVKYVYEADYMVLDIYMSRDRIQSRIAYDLYANTYD